MAIEGDQSRPLEEVGVADSKLILLDRERYFLYGEELDFAKPWIGNSWNFLLERYRIARQISVLDDIGKPVPKAVQEFYGLLPPVELYPPPEIPDLSFWSDDEKRLVGHLVVDSLKKLVDGIDEHTGAKYLNESEQLPYEVVVRKIKAAAGRKASLQMVEFWRSVVIAELGPDSFELSLDK